MTAHDSKHAPTRNEFDTTIQEYLLPIVREGGQLRIPAHPSLGGPEEEALLAPGTLIGDRHIVEEWLGNYSITQAYRVRHKSISTFSYILKTLRPSFAHHPEVLSQFRAEAGALARLRESLAPQVIDMGVLPDGRPFQCLEAIVGLSLDELTRIHGPQPEPVVWHIATDILSVIDEMHELDMTHGNLQPESIRLWKDPSSDEVHARILDFSTIQTHDAPQSGQPSTSEWAYQYRTLFPSRYLAPDCMASRNHATCDVYALGLVLAELLDGVPLHVNDQNNMASNAAADRLEHDVILGPFSSQSTIAEVLQRALHPDPDARYANAGDMLRAILTIAGRERPGIGAELTPGLFSRYTPALPLARPPHQGRNRRRGTSRCTDVRSNSIERVGHRQNVQGTQQGRVPNARGRSPRRRNRASPAPSVSTQDVEDSDALNRRTPLIIRILLVVAFMIAGFFLLFMGVPV